MGSYGFDEISKFYDLRGEVAIKENLLLNWNNRRPLHVSAPYFFVDEQLKQLYAGGKRRLLDLCCGTGIHALVAAEIGFEVRGVDISSKSIDAACKLAEALEKSDRCFFSVANVDSFLSENNEKFDVILISGSLYYLDLDLTLEQIKKSLAPGGVFICIETFRDNKFMALLRRARSSYRKNRDENTLNGLLGWKAIDSISSQFKFVKIQYFDFTTLFGFIFMNCMPLGRMFHRIASRIDYMLCNRLGMRFLAFKFVLIGQNSL